MGNPAIKPQESYESRMAQYIGSLPQPDSFCVCCLVAAQGIDNLSSQRYKESQEMLFKKKMTIVAGIFYPFYGWMKAMAQADSYRNWHMGPDTMYGWGMERRQLR